MLVISPKIHAIRFQSCYSAGLVSQSLTPIKMVSYRDVLKICSSFRTWRRLIYWIDIGKIEIFNFCWIPHIHRHGRFLKRSWQDCSTKNECWTDFFIPLFYWGNLFLLFSCLIQWELHINWELKYSFSMVDSYYFFFPPALSCWNKTPISLVATPDSFHIYDFWWSICVFVGHDPDPKIGTWPIWAAQTLLCTQITQRISLKYRFEVRGSVVKPESLHF